MVGQQKTNSESLHEYMMDTGNSRLDIQGRGAHNECWCMVIEFGHTTGVCNYTLKIAIPIYIL